MMFIETSNFVAKRCDCKVQCHMIAVAAVPFAIIKLNPAWLQHGQMRHHLLLSDDFPFNLAY